MSPSKDYRDLLLDQLRGKNAHVDFGTAVNGLSYEESGITVEKLPHTIWDLIEHIRIGQDDIMEFCKNPDYKEITWPDDYWPSSSKPENKAEFVQSIKSVTEGKEEMRTLVEDKSLSITKPFPHGDGQTLFREALLIVDHNAYHIGQIVQLRRLLGNWE